MNDQPELIAPFVHIAPPLEIARRRLSDAQRAELDAMLLLDNQGPEAQPAYDDAKAELCRAENEVARLERQAMRP
jgi:nitrous oxide reductase accessory protein NosL